MKYGVFKKFPFHPILFAIYPILFLYTNNISMLEIEIVFLPILFSVMLSLAVWAIVKFILKNWTKSSIITSLIIILFFSYGHLINAIGDIPEKYIGLNSSNYITINFLLVIGISVYIIITSSKDFLLLSKYLNFVSLGLLIFPLVIIFQSSHIVSYKFESNIEILPISKNQANPDIYYIVLDGYGSQDVLKSHYDYDNRSFLDELEKRGFVIKKKSRANYGQTLLSLSSTLNMNYLDTTLAINNKDSYRRFLSSTIMNNKAAAELRDQGYKFVTFATGYSGTEIKNSDLYIKPSFSLNEFQLMLIGTTPLSKLFEIIPDKTPLYLHRQRILFALENISKVDLGSSPIFLFAHIIAPHPPFVIGTSSMIQIPGEGRRFDYYDGSHYHSFNKNLQIDYKEKYIAQLTELNSLVIKMIDEILNKKDKRAIIILQSDHGPGLLLDWDNPTNESIKERMPILNAIYFHSEEIYGLEETASPVNTFRILFNNLFGGNFKILEDRSYFSNWSSPHKFYNVDSLF